MSDTIVFALHGFAGAPASLDPALPPGVRVVAPTIAGHGRYPVSARSWDEEVERLLGLLDEAGAPRAHLLGYSLGGRLGWSLLARAPERFASAVLVGAHPGLRTDEERRARAEADTRWIALLEERGLEAFVAAWEAQPIFATQTEAQREAQRAVRLSHTAGGLASALRVLGLAAMPPVDPANVRVPVTVLVGELDQSSSAAALPWARRVPGAGHNLLVERPGAVRAALEEALRRAA
ncbi:MAG TPA: alpha/beta fold hydrolase [Sandaracinaceae bacterium]